MGLYPGSAVGDAGRLGKRRIERREYAPLARRVWERRNAYPRGCVLAQALELTGVCGLVRADGPRRIGETAEFRHFGRVPLGLGARARVRSLGHPTPRFA